MLLKSSASFSLSSSASFIGDRKNAYSSTVLQFPWRNENVFGDKFVIKASKESGKASTLGTWFDPFEEVKKERLVVPTCPQDSLARLKFSSPCETAINEQIKSDLFISLTFYLLYSSLEFFMCLIFIFV